MRGFIRALCLLLVAGIFLSGCSVNQGEQNPGEISVVCTVFPLYDITREIMGDTPGNVTYLTKDGVDMHSLQPSVGDIAGIADADLFIYVGGESDEWTEDIDLKRGQRLRLMDGLGEQLLEEEIKEGMRPVRGESEGHGAHGDHEDYPEEAGHGEPEEEEFDEHIWLSLGNAVSITEEIEEALCGINPAMEDTYRRNAREYKERLLALDSEYRKSLDNAGMDTLIFGDRFPFRYLLSDYGIDYYAAFAGCSAETEASFETIAFLSDKADSLRAPYILTIEGGDNRMASTIADSCENRSVGVLSLDSMQGTKMTETNDTTYLSVMETNLEVIKKALEVKDE